MSAGTDDRLVGLMGYPVEHSLSPAMHNAAFRALRLPWRYNLLPVSPNELGGQIERCLREGYAGWNVTVPHKERMLAYLNTSSDEVSATGACNTVRVEDGRLKGYNTDVAGFLAGLAEAGGVESEAKAIVLGAGGASRAVAWALAAQGYRVIALSRRPEQAQALSDSLRASAGISIEHDSLDGGTLNRLLMGAGLLVNCTPAGMWPYDEESPLPGGIRLPERVLVYDLVYRPHPTRLLKEATLASCRTQDGLAMLVHQGAAAFQIWTGLEAPVNVMLKACLDALGAPRQPRIGATR